MTPEEAVAMKSGTTPGPWEWREHQHTSYKVEGPNRDYESLGTEDSHALQTQDAEDYASWFVASVEDKALIAAAPDMRATIAAQTWEYGVERKNPTKDYWEQITLQDGELWAHAEAYAEETAVWSRGIGYSSRLIRRPVGPVEVVE